MPPTVITMKFLAVASFLLVGAMATPIVSRDADTVDNTEVDTYVPCTNTGLFGGEASCCGASFIAADLDCSPRK